MQVIVGDFAELYHQASLRFGRQELHQREVIVRVHRKRAVRSRYKPTLANSLYLSGESRDELRAGQMLENRVRVNNVERLIGKRKRAPVENHWRNTREALPIIRHLIEGRASSGDPV